MVGTITNKFVRYSPKSSAELTNQCGAELKTQFGPYAFDIWSVATFSMLSVFCI